MQESQKAKILARLKKLIPSEEWDDNLIPQLVDDAEDWVLAYCNRTQVPDMLIRTIGDLATVAFNRLGAEGDKSRSEAGESYSFETAPAYIFKILDKYRIARVGGHAHETQTDESD